MSLQMFKLIMRGIIMIIRLIISENPSIEIEKYQTLVMDYLAFVGNEEAKENG